MNQRIFRVALECLLDLGVTVVYAVIVGLLIVGIVASDEGAVSILRTSVFAATLPGSAMLLIAAEVVLRMLGERRASAAPDHVP